MDVSSEDDPGCQRLHILLQITLQRSCTVDRIISAVDAELLCGVCQTDTDLPVRESPVQVLKKQVNDTRNILLRQRLEHDRLVKTVQEFRPEMRPQFILYHRECALADLAVLINAIQKE